jgi:putative membrane protein
MSGLKKKKYGVQLDGLKEEIFMKRFLYMTAASVYALLMMGCDGYFGPMGGRWDHMNCGYGFGGMFMWILFVIVIGVVAYFIIQGARARTSGTTPQETPLDILKKRYAKGEIAKEEYEKMKKDLDV